MRKFRIIYDEPGQSCNRFWSYVSSISWALENDGIVYVLFWDRNFEDFDKLFLKSEIIKFPFYNKMLWNFHVGSCYLYRSLFSKTVGHPIMRLKYREWYKSGGKYNFVSGWKTRGSTNYCQYTEVFKQLFRPNDNVVNKVDSLFEQIRHDFDFIIGIHIRRGDYKDYRDGIYYYSHEQYKKKMDELLELYKEGRNVCFFIASNEKVPIDVFTGLKFFIIPNASMAEDLYALSKCDCLVGPSSTFTRWVSFIEKIPLYYIFDIRKEINGHTVFTPIHDFFHFENGDTLPF